MLNPLPNLQHNRKLFFVGLLFLFFAIAFSFVATSKTSAYSAGRLIDDTVFLDANSMNAPQIQSFLVSRNSGLANMNFELQCYGPSSQERQWYTAVGAPCGTPIPASQIIYYAAQIYGVNPRVILATLQKEQSLITAPNPTSWQLNQAMGYGCPTSGGCGASTFSYQIDSGTWALRYHYERARGNNIWWNNGTWTSCGGDTKYRKPNAFPGQNVRFYDEADRLYTTIFIENAATSAFYCYTPHVFNNFPGCIAVWGVSYTSSSPTVGNTGNCYTGSYNFLRFYELWFGPTSFSYASNSTYAKSSCSIPLYSLSKVGRLYHPEKMDYFYTVNRTEACSLISEGYIWDGIMLSNYTGNNAIPVYRLSNFYRHLFTSSTTIRDDYINNRGYKLDVIAFYVQQESSTTLPVYCLVKDSTVVYTSASGERDILISNGFSLAGIAFFTENQSQVSSRVYRLSKGPVRLHTTNDNEKAAAQLFHGFYWEHQSDFYASKTPSLNTTPVYRISSKGSFFYTTNRGERDIAVVFYGYHSEGTEFYAYTQPSANLIPIYRLKHTPSADRLYTSSSIERDVAIQNFRYKSEDIAWYLESR
jgi:hypothetical protein